MKNIVTLLLAVYPVPVPEQLPQIAILPARHPDLRESFKPAGMPAGLQFCGFSYDPGSALARVLVLAFVFIKLNHPVYFRVVLYWLFGMKLHVARFADAYGNGGTLHYPKIALGHAWPLF